jgi:hypothetical protein
VASGAEVDLGFFAGRPFDAHDGLWLMGLKGADEAVDGGVGAGEALLFEAVPDGGDFGALFAKLSDQGAIGLNGRDNVRWRRELEGLLDQALELVDGRQGRVEEALLRSPGAIALDGLAMSTSGALNGAVTGGELNMPE